MSTPILAAHNSQAMNRALKLLQAGKLVIVPTETVYGLAARPDHRAALDKVYAIKKREAQKALIAHVDGLAMAEQLAELNELARQLIAAFWPGPLTLIVPKKVNELIDPIASGGLEAIALRCPDHDFTRELITRLGTPLLAPSANLAGQAPPTRVEDISPLIADGADLIIDGGSCRIGQASTLLDLWPEQAVILRQGALSREELEKVSGPLG
ncbi:MAG: threonylcarbamoyl-AMP synthase [Robiginitomaculum sp.]|nr:MAG: threonylcarbamoyl-AMP synthase [Robiginitomaculum sp.]